MKADTDINHLLHEEYCSAVDLCDILKSERDALANNTLDVLNELATRKQTLVEQLEKLARKRVDWLARRGIAADADALKEFISQSDKELKLAWEKLLAKLEECQQLNRVNGSIVKQLQRKISNALAILQGQPDNADLYSRNGKTVTGSNTNILTRA